jgi:hypothetical protein
VTTAGALRRTSLLWFFVLLLTILVDNFRNGYIDYGYDNKKVAAVSTAALVAGVLIARVSLDARLVFVSITAWSLCASPSGPSPSSSITLLSIAS